MSTPPPFIITTSDGSHSLVSQIHNESYHSENGALQESLHVFIEAGFRVVSKPKIAVFEVGFGTGLNALLTALEAEKTKQEVYYEAIELYPIDLATAQTLNYANILGVEQQWFEQFHSSEWNLTVPMSPYFSLQKIKGNLLHYTPVRKFDLIYFDAFCADTQPELWSREIFEKMYNLLKDSGILVTYSSKGIVKQALRSVGFTVQRLPGAAGKRHMLRAVKNEKVYENFLPDLAYL